MKKRLLSLLLAVSMLVGMLSATAYADTMPFTDLAENAWYTTAVQYVYDNGIMSGKSTTTFAPDANLTRAETCQILYNYEGQPGYTGDAFTDVSSNQWFYAAVNWAADNGIVTGMTEDTFEPDSQITREQMVTILYRYASYKGYDVSATDDLSGYTDAGSVSSWALTAMQWAVASGCVSGMTETTLGPQGTATRAQMATIFMRFAQNTEAPQDVADDTTEIVYDSDNSISMIDGTFTDQTVLSEQDAADVLNSFSDLFGEDMEVSADEISVQSVDNDDLTASYYRYSPTVNGIPVIGSQIILVTDGNGTVTSLFSTYTDAIEGIDTTASISEEDAKEAALAALLAEDDVVEFIESVVSDDLDYSSAEAALKEVLNTSVEEVIYAASDDLEPFYAYSVSITSFSTDEIDDTDWTASGSSLTETIDLGESVDDSYEDEDTSDYIVLPEVDKTYYVYANGDSSGEIALSCDNVEDWTTVSLSATDSLGNTRYFIGQEEDGEYRLVDSTRNLATYKSYWRITNFSFLNTSGEWVLPGNIATSLTLFGERMSKTAVSVHANMSEVYDFYKNVLGRDSFDDNGAKIKVSYNYGTFYKNAYWSSTLQQMVFGDDGGFTAALDVAGHEFTHAVINYVVGDGVNTSLTYYGESGALNESYADIMGALIEGKSGDDKWLLGEDSDSAVRSMSDPSAYGQPEHYSDLYTGTGDNGGVHTNSGIFNYAAYKMMTDSRTSSVSDSTWAKVFYYSLNKLETDAAFRNARYAVISTAEDLGFAENQVQAIKDTFDAVGIYDWVVTGDAQYDEETGDFVLTENVTWKVGGMWYSRKFYGDFTISFDYYTGTSSSGADGIAVAFYAESDYTMTDGQYLGFSGSQGYGIELDTYYNSDMSDPNYNHIALIQSSGSNHLITAELPESEDGEWHNLKVCVEDDTVYVYVDGTLKFSYEGIEATGYGDIGITSATGASRSEHRIRNIEIHEGADIEE